MSFADDWLQNGLPVYSGGKDRSTARRLIDRLGGPSGTKKAYQNNPDGTVTTVHTRGAQAPEITVSGKKSKVADRLWIDIVSGATKYSGAQFCPTQNAYTYSLHGQGAVVPNQFSPTSMLDPRVDFIIPTQYTGLMAKLVQLVLGYQVNTPTLSQTPLSYGSSWRRTHGITTDALGELWLIQIGAASGDPLRVLAMRLPVFPGSGLLYKNSPVHAVREAIRLFKDLPTCGNFPTGAALNAALADGSVKQLASVADMLPYFSTTSPVDRCGWSFNQSGSEAHNTSCWKEAGEVYGGHFKLAIDVDAGVATLTLLEKGVLYRGRRQGVTRCYFNNPGGLDGAGQYEGHLAGQATVDSSTPLPPVSGPIFVCHVDDTVDVVREAYKPAGTGYNADNSYTYPISNTHAQDDRIYIYNRTLAVTGPYWVQYWLYSKGQTVNLPGLNFVVTEDIAWVRVNGGWSYSETTSGGRIPSAFTFPSCARDVYVVTVFTTHSRTTISEHGNPVITEAALVPRSGDDAIFPDPPETLPIYIYHPPQEGVVYHIGAPQDMHSYSWGYSDDEYSISWDDYFREPYDIRFSVLGDGETNGYHTYYHKAESTDPWKIKTYGNFLAFEGSLVGGPEVATITHNFIGYV